MSDRAFTRNRKLSFPELVMIVLKGAKRGIHAAIQEVRYSDQFDVDSYSDAAFSKARRKINYTAFEELSSGVAQMLCSNRKNLKTFLGYRVWAVDGSKVDLPTNPQTLDEFGSENFTSGPLAQGLASCLYDTLNSVVLDACIERHDANERELALRHIDALERFCNETNTDKRYELVTFDRGYPSAEIIERLMEAGFSFVMRVNKENFWREIRKAKGDDTLISRGSKKLRMIQVPLEKPETTAGGKTVTTATLLTNLMDTEASKSQISEFYRLRWKIETNYGFLKRRIELENFTGTSPLCVRQDYHAAMLLTNLIACVIYDTRDEVAAQCESRQYEYKINMTESYRELHREMYNLVLAKNTRVFNRVYNRIQKSLLKTVIPIRDGRTPKRGEVKYGRIFYHNRKPS